MPRAGEFRHRVAFEKRVALNDGMGNREGAFEAQFERAAKYIHVRGGEDVMAGRLAGRHVQIITIRADAAAKTISPAWRCRDVRTGTVYNIRDITVTENGMWVDLLCETGVAT